MDRACDAAALPCQKDAQLHADYGQKKLCVTSNVTQTSIEGESDEKQTKKKKKDKSSRKAAKAEYGAATVEDVLDEALQRQLETMWVMSDNCYVGCIFL